RASAEMREHFRSMAHTLVRAGYKIRSVDAMADFAGIYERHFAITNGEAARSHRDWFPRFRELYHPKTVEKLEAGQAVSDEDLERAQRDCTQFMETLTDLMRQQRIDLWISPSAVEIG